MLSIEMTKLQSLDVSKLPRLQMLNVPFNNIQHIKMKDSSQLDQIEYLHIDYNFYTQMFFEEFRIREFKSKIYTY